MDEAQNLKLRIVSKLKTLNCPFLANDEDWWVNELLFSEEPHRYQLIEWILSKLDLGLLKESGGVNSPMFKMKYLLSVTATLGICQKSDWDLIKGKCTIPVQLKFWETLTNLLWVKNRLKSEKFLESDEAYVSQEGNISDQSIADEFEKSCSFINKVAENVNMKHLFDARVNLFSPDVMKECKNTFTDLTLKSLRLDLQILITDAKKRYCNDLSNDEVLLSLNDRNLSFDVDQDALAIPSEKENSLQREIGLTFFTLKSLFEEFDIIYTDFKQSIRVSSENLSPIGPAFKTVMPSIKKLQELQVSLATMKSSCNKLKILNDQAKRNDYPELYFSNSVLSDFISKLEVLIEDASLQEINSNHI